MEYGIFIKAVTAIYDVPAEYKLTRQGEMSAVSDEGLYGQRFAVLDLYENLCENDYVRIKTEYNYDGYVRKSDVRLYDDICCRGSNKVGFASAKFYEEPESEMAGNTTVMAMRVIKPFADVVSEPAVKGRCLCCLVKGSIVQHIYDDNCNHKNKNGHISSQDNNGYIKVRLYDGRYGYIRAASVAPYNPPLNSNAVSQFLEGGKPDLSQVDLRGTDEQELRAALIRTAKEYIGTQYRWGGKTPLGIDCSGLASMSYMLNGVLIYRDAEIKNGFPVHEIDRCDMKPGDLIYFPGHIAMYIGNNEYIHSTARSGSEGVVINSLDSSSDAFRKDLCENIIAIGSIF